MSETVLATLHLLTIWELRQSLGVSGVLHVSPAEGLIRCRTSLASSFVFTE